MLSPHHLFFHSSKCGKLLLRQKKLHNVKRLVKLGLFALLSNFD